MATRWLNHTSALLAALALTGCATRGIDPGPSVGDVMKGQTAPDPDVLPIIKSEPIASDPQRAIDNYRELLKLESDRLTREESERRLADLQVRMADAEGATHDIAITVSGAVSEEAAEAAARTVSSSNLLKCAVAGADPNWGRILSQLGTVPEDVCPFNPDEVDVAINGITIFSHGAPQPNRDAVDMSPRETRIDIELSAGPAQATVWTNDLTHGYVTINADYTT